MKATITQELYDAEETQKTTLCRVACVTMEGSTGAVKAVSVGGGTLRPSVVQGEGDGQMALPGSK